MKHILTTLLICFSIEAFPQLRVFTGYIDKYPIHLVTYSYSDGVTQAIYSYDKYDTPINLDGRQNNDSLILSERNEKGEANLEFTKFNSENNEIKGKWISHNKQTILDIKLNKLHEFESYDSAAFEKLELMQPESTKDNYFKLLISKNVREDIQVTGVRIYEKKTDRLIQEINLECQFWGLNNISVNDYNFDGIEDFSVFESSYAGPNTSSIYILKDPGTGEYFVSDISGISLEFDAEAKLIYEHNQCCAGRSHMNATYKLVDNKMELIEQHCIEYDDEKEDFIETDCN